MFAPRIPFLGSSTFKQREGACEWIMSPFRWGNKLDKNTRHVIIAKEDADIIVIPMCESGQIAMSLLLEQLQIWSQNHAHALTYWNRVYVNGNKLVFLSDTESPQI
jgi:hypothetical protein